MTLQAVPAFIAADSGGTPIQHPVELMRNLIAYLATRSGMVRPGDFAATVVASQMQLTVAAGAAVLLGAESATQGAYFAWSDAAETLAWPAASSQDRYDTLVLRVRDPQYGTITGSADSDWNIVQGTPGASPTPVTDASFAAAGANYVPGAWLRVYDILVPANATQLTQGNVTQKAQYCGLLGFTLATSFSGLPASPRQGERGYTMDTDKVYYAVGASPSWKSTGVANRPVFIARQNNSQSIANDASYPSDTTGCVQLTGWTVEQDSHLGFASNAYTIPVTGIYRVTGSWVAGGTNNGNSGNRRILFKTNGTVGTACAGTVHGDTNSKQLSVALPGKLYSFTAGDVITLFADQLQGTGTGAVTTTQGNGAESTWTITYEHQ